MHALIDGDIVAYRCAASAEGDPVEIALKRTDNLLNEILQSVSATTFKCYLTGSDNFRKEIFPDYKANRTQPKPRHLEACREYLCTEYGAIVTDGHEADDALGMDQTEDTSVICSIDKDLLQVPGNHFNFVKKEVRTVTPLDGIRHFYSQMLIGDRSDNIKGVAGIGEKKADKYLRDLETEEQMFDLVRSLYDDDFMFLMNGQLLWIWREYRGTWQPMKQLSIGQESTPLEQEVESESMMMKQTEQKQSTELI
jgi:5'-3' exonuclease